MPGVSSILLSPALYCATIVIDSDVTWSTLTDGTTTIRKLIRDGYYVVDKTLTELGFDGVEDTDWENVKATSLLDLWITYFSNNPNVLFFGLYSEISGGQMPNKVSGATDYLTVTGVTGSEIYQAPHTAPYEGADIDYIWFRTDSTQRAVTTAELIGYDFSRTIVKYDSVTGELISILILKSTAVVSGAFRDSLFYYMDLPIFWDDSLNNYGHLKFNRIAYLPWAPIKYLYKPVGNEYAYVVDNNALDVKDDPFVMCGWVLGYDKTALNYLFGKGVYGGLNGRYGFYSNQTTGYISANLQGGSGTGVVNSTIDVTSGWHFLLMETFKQAGGEIIFRLYIDNVLIGTSGLCGYSLGTMANAFEFCIGTGNNGSGSGFNYTAKASFRDIRIYRIALSADDKTNLYNGLNVPGYVARWKFDSYPLQEELNNYDLTGVNLSSINIKEL